MLEMKKIYNYMIKNGASFSIDNINDDLDITNESLILNGSVKLINNIVVLSDLQVRMD
ncbi:hypothetical protein [Clostridium sp.]|uniref:hypothetical protein n=2 Tax=Clostridium sp. TaxID=1506 RepID=UPI001EC1669E|nr:hypothetical protein [Clostridium sp.]MBS5885586.1 hypothetical protein [Clostridium sp.]